MKHRFIFFVVGVGLLIALAWFAGAADLPKPSGQDLSEYRTAENAIASRISLAAPGRAALGGYLGVRVSADERGRLVVADVQADSPGARAGLQVGDVVGQVDGQPAVKVDVLRELLQARAPGEAVKLGVVRGDKPMELTATLTASSRPMKLGGQPVTFGATVGEAQEGTGAPVERVAPNSPADKAGV